MSIPQIVILEQITPGHERYANDKVQKDVGVCVKKKGFPIKVSTENQDFDFSKVNLNVSLLYDNNSQAPVDFIEQVPLTIKTKISKDKMSATIDVTILVLSSQLENSLFLIKIRAENKKDKKDFSECISMPIKVVSKVTQLNTKAKKRTRNRSTPTKEMFINAMEKLDKGQEKHSELLATLLEQSRQQTLVLQTLLQVEADDMIQIIKQDDKILEDVSTSQTAPKRIKLESTQDKIGDGKSSFANNQLDFAFKDLFDSFSILEGDEFNKVNQFDNHESFTEENFPFSFNNEEVINSESPNHILSYDLSSEDLFDEIPLVPTQKSITVEEGNKEKTKTILESIDFGSFPNLFSFN